MGGSSFLPVQAGPDELGGFSADEEGWAGTPPEVGGRGRGLGEAVTEVCWVEESLWDDSAAPDEDGEEEDLRALIASVSKKIERENVL